MIRLQRFMAECGVASRRQSERIIAEGRVAINGRVAQIGETIDPESDEITVDGVGLCRDRTLYLLLNKPRGVVTTLKDKYGRKTILEFLKGVGVRVFPVGRLDMDVGGALILTNDGELAHRLAHPRFEVEKVYRVRVKGTVRTETTVRLTAGLRLEDGFAAADHVRILDADRHASLLRIVLHEGRKREVKRLCAAVGHPVIELQRVSVGNVSVDDLRPGEWRPLSNSELADLRRLVGL